MKRHPHLHSIACNAGKGDGVRDKDAFASPRLEKRIQKADERRKRKKEKK